MAAPMVSLTNVMIPAQAICQDMMLTLPNGANGKESSHSA
jgi:hypothetical protein